jgi:hypothetical protein
LKKGLLGSSLVDPMILLWSSAPSSSVSHYWSGNNYEGCLSRTIKNSYNNSDNYMMNYENFFLTVQSTTTKYEDTTCRAEYGVSQKQFRIMN